MILVADTSGLIAASDKNAPESADCQSLLAAAGTVVVSPLVLADTGHLAKARFGSAARIALIDFIDDHLVLGERAGSNCIGPSAPA